MFRKFLQRGQEEVYFREVEKILNRSTGPVVIHEVIGEAQYYLFMQHGWSLHSVEAPAYGQWFKHRHMSISRAKLEGEVRYHEHHAIS